MFDNQVIPRKSSSGLSIRLLWPFLEIIRQHQCGRLIERFQNRLGLTGPQLHHPETRVPLRVAGSFLTEAVQALRMQSLGLAAAARIRSEHLGLTEYLARSSDTLGAALVSSRKYAGLLCDGAHHAVEIQDDHVFLRFWFDSNVSMHEAAYEFALATQISAIRRIARAPSLAPQEVHFMHPQPENVTPHQQLFRCKLRFNMPFCQLVLPGSLITWPLPGSEPALRRLLEQQAHMVLSKGSESREFILLVRNIVATETTLRGMSAKRVAQRLGISTRTLARRLAVENTKFTILFDQMRKDLALRELTTTQLEIRDIAGRLGFASTQSFHRAFRRWTGATTASFRKIPARNLLM